MVIFCSGSASLSVISLVCWFLGANNDKINTPHYLSRYPQCFICGLHFSFHSMPSLKYYLLLRKWFPLVLVSRHLTISSVGRNGWATLMVWSQATFSHLKAFSPPAFTRAGLPGLLQTLNEWDSGEIQIELFG